jgi:4-hydroxy-4-methyl-2-oxoglutarate aldolase
VDHDSTLSSRLAHLQTCTVADVLDEMGHRDQVVAAAIRPLDPRLKVAGPAFCVQGRSAPGSTVQASRQGGSPPGYEMFRRMRPGCVIVMETGGLDTAGPWGENMALSARARGCAGIVVDGGTRDSRELVAMDFPCFARFATPARIEGRWTYSAFDLPVTMPGQTGQEVVVEPNDVVLGDADGVVIVPQTLAAEVVEFAEEVERIEAVMREQLVAGIDRELVYRTHDRYAHIRRMA